MITDKPCPTCNHLHPRGIGAAICGCPDCSLLWTTIPFDLLSPQSQVRLKGLIAMQDDIDALNNRIDQIECRDAADEAACLRDLLEDK